MNSTHHSIFHLNNILLSTISKRLLLRGRALALVLGLSACASVSPVNDETLTEQPLSNSPGFTIANTDDGDLAKWKLEVEQFYSADPELIITPYMEQITGLEDWTEGNSCAPDYVANLRQLLALNSSSMVAYHLLGKCSNDLEEKNQLNAEATAIAQVLMSKTNGLTPKDAIEIREFVEAHLLLDLMGVSIYDVELISHGDSFLYKFHTFNGNTNKLEHRYFSNMRLLELVFESYVGEENDVASSATFFSTVFFSQGYGFANNMIARSLLERQNYAAVIELLQNNYEHSSLSAVFLAEAYMKSGEWEKAQDPLVVSELYADLGFDEAMLTQAQYILNVLSNSEGLERVFELVDVIDQYSAEPNGLERLLRKLVDYEEHQSLLTALYDHNRKTQILEIVTQISLDKHRANQHEVELSLLQFAAERGHADALAYLAESYKDGDAVDQDLNKAIDLYADSFAAGNASAKCQIGLIYRDYADVYNMEQAIQYLSQAAQLEDGGCEFDLAYTYDELTREYDKARHWYEIAVAGNDGAAMTNLGLMYQDGRGVNQDIEKARTLFLGAIEQGDSSGHVNLGRMYENGWGVERDYSQAFYHYSEGTELNNDQAMHNLANLYLTGRHVEKDRAKANELFKKAAARGNQYSLFNLGNAYRFGRGEEVDLQKALKFYQRSANAGEARAFCELGEMYMDYAGMEDNELAKNHFLKGAETGLRKCQFELGFLLKEHLGAADKSISWFKKAAAQGHAEATHSLGIAYHFGYGVEADVLKAIPYYEKATDLGHSTSPANLGYIYEAGEGGVRPSNAKAIEFYHIAAQRDDPQGSNNLATFYKYGIEVEKDIEKAFNLYKKAAEGNNKFALNNLGKMYFHGDGVEENYEIAFDYFERSAALDFPDAIHSVGAMYFYGTAPEQNYSKAIEYLSRTSKLGNALSSLLLGVIYSTEDIPETDPQSAVRYLSLSHEQGDDEAAFVLAEMYHKGELLEQNSETAAYWYQQAFDVGYVEASDKLAELYWYGRGIEKNEATAMDWVRKHALARDYNANSLVGQYFYFGGILEKDYSQALHYFELAAQENDHAALNNLGEMYRFAQGVEKDEARAMEYYLRSVDSGSRVAMYNLGEMFSEGQGVAVDEGKSLEWFQKSAEKGFPEAMFVVGEMYKDGRGIQSNLAEANNWFLKAAREDHEEAMFAIAKTILEKESDLISQDEAFNFLNQSADQGHQPALDYLQSLKFKGSETLK